MAPGPSAEFEQHRSRLFGMAYRMLGSVEDARDLVQEAFIRWSESPRAEIATPEAWLVAVVTRLAIDRLRRAKSERAAYAGPWLPEPVATLEAPDLAFDRKTELSIAYLVLLERLSPSERAALLLRDVLDYDYSTIAGMLGKSEAAARQLLHRARERLQGAPATSPMRAAEQSQTLDRFLAALAAGDAAGLLSCFNPEVTFTSDGGGKVAAARRTVLGAERVTRFLLGLEKKALGHNRHLRAEFNGEPAFISYRHERAFGVTSLLCKDERIIAFYRVLNPQKLGNLGHAAQTRRAG